MERVSRGVTVGIDVGTTSTKAGIHDLAGQELGVATVQTTLRRGGGGALDQDPEELFASATSAIRAARGQSGVGASDVMALAVTGQMAGVMGIDAGWSPVTPYDSWLDARCAPHLDALAADHGDLLLARTGCPPLVDHAPKMQWWRDVQPATYARVERFVMPGVYVAGRLAGLGADEAFIDPTYLHFTGVADARAGAWSAELVAALGLASGKLPRIVACDEVIGYLTHEAAQACDLPSGLPLVAGMGDTAAGALGAGLVDVGQLLDTAGTAAVLMGCMPAYQPDPEGALIVMHGALPEQWAALNYVAGGGLCLSWLAAQLSPGATDIGATDSARLEGLLSEAADVPAGADGLLFLPHLQGRVVPYQPTLRGGFSGLSLGHTRGHLARAILEGVAFEYALYLESMRRLYPDVGAGGLFAIGGGSRSRLWNSIKADVLGVSVTRVAVQGAATRGAALIAAGAVAGVDVAAVAADVAIGEPLGPDPARHELYVERLDAYRRLLDASAALTTALSPAERILLV